MKLKSIKNDELEEAIAWLESAKHFDCSKKTEEKCERVAKALREEIYHRISQRSALKLRKALGCTIKEARRLLREAEKENTNVKSG